MDARDHQDAVAPRFTNREREVLQLMADGKTARASGQILDISHNAVNFHRKRAMKKLGCFTTTLAVSRAVALGLVTVDLRWIGGEREVGAA